MLAARAASFRVVVVSLAIAAVATACSSGGSSDAEGTEKGAPPSVCNATTVADKVLPTVVMISVTNGTVFATGSGEVVRDDGSILTNNHVVAPAAGGGTISVLFSDGVRLPASIRGRDAQTDVAVIKVEPPTSLATIPLGSSSTVVVGEPVVVLGAPLGLANTITTGIVSALNRTVHVPSDNGTTAVLISAVQTDAAINPGNSGGAMTDCAGNLIGVPSAGATVTNEAGETSAGSVGIGFAIPVDVAKEVSDQLIATGTVTHSYFGLQVATISPAAAKQAGKPAGLYVATVTPGGPAEVAGLKVGDVITEVDGKPATDPNQLLTITLTKKPGETVMVAYVREGQTLETTITLAAVPSAA